jgi:hypothetical protein
MPPKDLYTVVTEELITEIRLAAARCGSIGALAAEMGINERRIRTVICQRIVSLSWMDRFCTNAPTELWVTDFEWKKWWVLMNELEKGWTHERSVRSYRTRRKNARKLYVSPNDGAEAVHDGESLAGREDGVWTAGDGPRDADSDEGHQGATDDGS